MQESVLEPKAVHAVVATNSPAYVNAVFDLLSRGHIVVPIRDTNDRSRIEAAQVTKVIQPEAGHGWFQPQFESKPSDDVAQISFTSGTEGEPKGVPLTHAALADVVRRLNDVMGLRSEVKEYVGVPVYYSFGFGRCRAVADVGGECYLPANGFDPLELSELINEGSVNAVSAVPSLWRLVLDMPQLFSEHGDRVLWIEIGSQYMSASEKRALRALFPRARIVQHYGLTEASRSTFLEVDSVDETHLESVGKAYGDVEVRIGSDGRVQIRGPHVVQSLLVGGEKVPAQDAEGWLTTSDLGNIRDGYLHYGGRADDVINCGGIKLAPDRLEKALARRTSITSGFAVCRIPDPARGDGVLLATITDLESRRQELVDALIEEAEEQGVRLGNTILGVELAELPQTTTGKVQRKRIAEEHQNEARPIARSVSEREGDSDESGDGRPRTERERELLAIWKEALGTKRLRVDESFYDLGGDSITALSVVVRMSRAGIDPAICRAILQGATIRELGRAGQTGGESRPERRTHHRDFLDTLMVNALRGFLVLAVISGHWSEGAIDRLPAVFSVLSAPLAPYFSFGTPGFAIVFGVGFGYLYLERLKRTPERVWATMRLGMKIVGIGILTMTALKLAIADTFAIDRVFESFYSVLLFYFLALPTMPWWGRLTHPAPDRWRGTALVGYSVGCFIVQHGLHLLLDDVQAHGPLLLARLMLVAKYNYFSMMGGVLLGVATGDWLRRRGEGDVAPRQLLTAGVAITAVALAAGGLLGELNALTYWPSPLHLWKWPFYWGIVLVLLAALWWLRRDYATRPPLTQRVIEALASVGQLALPFYVTHELVLPFKAYLTVLGVPSGLAILIPLVLFFAASWFMVRRVHGLVFSS